jgi:hypothetical protein
MPRLYAPNLNHNITCGDVDFVNGVAAVAADTAAETLAYFTGKSYTQDNSKHTLTILDALTLPECQRVAEIFGVDLTDITTKQATVRAIETAISAAKLDALTVASSAGTATGDTNIDVTSAGSGQLYYKKYTNDTLAAAGAPLYRDAVPSGWTAFATNADITAATGTGIGVIEANTDGLVVGFGHSAVTAKA